MEILLDPKEAQKNIGKARLIVGLLTFHLPVRILSKFFKRKKAKPYRLLILRNAVFRFLICGMPDFLLYDIFYAFLKLSSKGKQVPNFNKYKKKNKSVTYFFLLRIIISWELDFSQICRVILLSCEFYSYIICREFH